jgi:D-alanyl-D-alanine dipeptidase
MRLAAFLFFIFLLACNPPAPQTVVAPEKTGTLLPPVADTAESTPAPQPAFYSALEQQLLDSGLVDLQKLDSAIAVDLRYSTTDNFMKMDLYGDFTHAFLQPDIAERFLKAQEELRKRHPGYSLIIYDATRPMHIQRRMWDTLDMPARERQKYLSNPAHGGSLHNYGAAVDVSILDDQGVPLDMGTPYDYFGEKAHPVLEKAMLDSGELSLQQVHNRQLLREVMRKGGFWGIQTEWWHFNACTRDSAMVRYRLVE